MTSDSREGTTAEESDTPPVARLAVVHAATHTPLFIYATAAGWTASAAAGGSALPVRPRRDAAAAAREWCDAWMERVARLPAARRIVELDGVSIWDSARLSIVAAQSTLIQELWRVRQAASTHHASAVHFEPSGSGPEIDRACRTIASSLGITFVERAPRATAAMRMPAAPGWRVAAAARVRDGVRRRFRNARRRWLPPQVLQASIGPRVLFADFFPNNVNALLPIFRQVASSQDLDARWLALREDVADRLTDLGIGHVNLWRTSPRAIARECRERSRELSVAFAVLEQDRDFAATFNLDGADVHHALWPLWRPAVENAVVAASHMVIAARHALRALEPDVVVVGNDATMPCRAFVLAARSLGLATVYVQHGLVPRDQEVLPGASDRLLIWGASSRRAFLELGNSDSQLIEVGATQYDRIFSRPLRDAAPSPVVWATAGRPLIVYTSAPTSRGEQRDDYVTASEAVAHAAAQVTDADFIVKLHPSEDESLWSAIQRHSGARHLRIIRECDTLGLLAAADLVITRFSTTGMEAIILGKPLLMLNLTDEQDRAPYAEAGAAIPVRAVTDLVPQIRRVLNDPLVDRELAPFRERLIADTFADNSGTAAWRAGVEIERMARSVYASARRAGPSP